MAHCANEHAKEKQKKEKEMEEKNTILSIYHGTLLATMGNYLQNDMHNSKKQILIFIYKGE